MDDGCWSPSASNPTNQCIENCVAARCNGSEVRPKEAGGSEEAQLTDY